jgi:hypothetical protein
MAVRQVATKDRPNRFSRGRPWLIAGCIVIALTAMAAAMAANFIAPLVKNHMIQALQESYESAVELRAVDIALFPSVRVVGEGLVLRHRGRTDIPPLISIRKFSATAGWLGLLRSPARVERVYLEGLQIHIPPRGNDAKQENGAKPRKQDVPRFLISEVSADGTFLEILPKKAGKEPLQFEIEQLTLWGVGPADPMSFRATLTNAKPVGKIHSEGRFGPWQRDEPGLTPVSGRYTFQHADLSVFRGISGILSSEGAYSGVLDAIQVQGTSDTPDFKLDISGKAVHLVTQFHAEVDGTDGDTRLDPVNAQFGRSAVTARGAIEGKAGTKGKTISLDVTVSEGRLEDMLRLGVKSDKAMLNGAIGFHTSLLIPPGDQDVVEKLQLDGRFAVGEAHLTKVDIQQKVNELSHRGRGETEDSEAGSIASNFRGRFLLKNAVMTFENLSFDVPGVTIHLNGTYGLRNERFDLKGTASLQAKLSETTTGFKSFLLKAVDPLFKKKNAGAMIPIKIEGSKDSPSFGLNL